MRALRRTLGHRTARFRYEWSARGPLPRELRGADPPRAGEGTIDFAARAYRLGDSVHARTRPPIGSPFWLVDVCAGVDRARRRGSAEAGGATCARYRCSARMMAAAEAAPEGLAGPVGLVLPAWRIALDVLVDDAGRLRRVGARWRARLRPLGAAITLFDFDEPPPVERPAER